MIISSVTKKNGKTDIYADGELKFTVATEIWYASPLFDGMDAEEAELESLKTLSDSLCAYQSAVRMLSLRGHSEYELMMKLRRKYDDTAVKVAVEKCRELGYLDDESFSKLLARELCERKNYAPSRILSELASRGIDRETARLAVKELDIDAEKCIIYIAEHYLPENADAKQKKTFIDRLLRLGYNYWEIKNALSELFEGNDDSV